jgi:O-antigen/teichoic acid export membrane protein
MLAVAPLAIRGLGIERYGIWMIAGTAISIGAIAASGFGDANIRVVAMQRATGDLQNVLRAVRSTMGIHIVLGCTMGIAMGLLAPLLTARLVNTASGLHNECLWSLRIASVLILLRSVETVCVSTQRAFERYGEAVRISAVTRLLSLAAAGVLPFFRPTVTGILLVSAAISLCGVWLQLRKLCRLLSVSSLMPVLDRQTTMILLSFGIFAWIQAVSGLAFGQMDRLFTGVAFGATAVTAYSLCVQLAQPIYGVAAAGLHSLFPRISAQHALGNPAGVRGTIFLGVVANLVFVAVATAGLLLFGESFLRVWGGDAIARTGASILPAIVWSTSAAGLGVAGAYSMLALGRVKTTTAFTLAGGALTAVAMPMLAKRYGLPGLAWGRLLYGPVSCLIYLPMLSIVRNQAEKTEFPALSTPACEELI